MFTPTHSAGGKPARFRRAAQPDDQGFDAASGVSQVLVEFGDGTTMVVPQNQLTDYRLPADGTDRKTASGKQGAAQKDPQHESPASPVVRQEDAEKLAPSRSKRKSSRKSGGSKKKAGRGAKRAKTAKKAKTASRKKRL